MTRVSAERWTYASTQMCSHIHKRAPYTDGVQSTYRPPAWPLSLRSWHLIDSFCRQHGVDFGVFPFCCCCLPVAFGYCATFNMSVRLRRLCRRLCRRYFRFDFFSTNFLINFIKFFFILLFFRFRFDVRAVSPLIFRCDNCNGDVLDVNQLNYRSIA